MKITIAKTIEDPRGRSTKKWTIGKKMQVDKDFGKKLIEEGLAVEGHVQIKKAPSNNKK